MRDNRKKIEIALLSLRLSTFLVLAMWTWDKFRNPVHAAGVFANFYGLHGMAPVMYAIAVVETLVIIGFVLGIARTWTYGIVLVLHAGSTLSSYAQYLTPFASPNLLFFTAWPMLAACFTLFLLRDQDQLLTLRRRTP